MKEIMYIVICGFNVIVVIKKQVKKSLTPHTTKTRGNDVLEINIVGYYQGGYFCLHDVLFLKH